MLSLTYLKFLGKASRLTRDDKRGIFARNATTLGELEKFGAFGWECICKIAVLDPIGASGLDDSVRDGKGYSKRLYGWFSWRSIGWIRWQHVLEE
jgi:hypothetical protein